jgi:hypothetical protein
VRPGSAKGATDPVMVSVHGGSAVPSAALPVRARKDASPAHVSGLVSDGKRESEYEF